jgi:DNA-binding CsgD family transcriptional regulator/tetratricopeptide (TPR) repeat protein
LSSAEFVGRHQELGFLREELHRALQGNLRFLFIEGDVGIGKSRLITEFLASLSGEVTIASGWCRADAPAYQPVSEFLRRLDPRRQVADMRPAGHDGSEQRAAYHEAVAHTIERESSRGGLIIVVEDLHFADAPTLELLTFLVHRLFSAGALLLLSGRPADEPEDLSTKLRSAAARRGHSRLLLGGMHRNEIRRLVQQALEARDLRLEPAVLAKIEMLADGNPLFAEELARMAVENGALDFRSHLPATVKALLIAALAGFSDEEQDVLCHAAAIGEQFGLSLLGEIAGSGYTSMIKLLQRAVRRGLLREDPHDPQRFHFCRPIVRAALADRLIQAVTIPLHARIATALEASADANERAAELAYHWSASRTTQKARQWNEAAAEAAFKARAYRDAARFYSAALEWSYPPGPARATVYERLGTALYMDGSGDQAAGWFARARAEREALGERDGVAQALLQFADQAWVDARTSEALAVATRAAGDFERAGEPGMHARAVLTSARFSSTLGEPERALAHLHAIAGALRPLDPAARACAHEIRGEALALLGRTHQALRDLRAGARLAAHTRDSELISQVENNFALAAVDLGDLRVAESRHTVALEEARRTGMTWRVAYSALNYAWTLTLAGRLEQARALLWEALETGVTTATFKTKAASAGIRVAVLLQDRALRTACADTRALEYAIRSGETQRIGSVAAAWAEMNAADGATQEARNVLSEAAQHVRRAHRCWRLFLWMAQLGDDPQLLWSREMLQRSTARPCVKRAYRLLFEALAAQRAGSSKLKRLAYAAVKAMSRLGHRLYEANALELAGEWEAALRLYCSFGDAYDAARLRLRIDRPNAPVLTARQTQIAHLVASGHTNRAIAASLHISEHTVEHHISQIFARLKLKTRSQLAGYWPSVQA